MYDYISNYSKDYSTSIVEEFLITTLKFSKDNNLEFYKEIFEQKLN